MCIYICVWYVWYVDYVTVPQFQPTANGPWSIYGLWSSIAEWESSYTMVTSIPHYVIQWWTDYSHPWLVIISSFEWHKYGDSQRRCRPCMPFCRVLIEERTLDKSMLYLSISWLAVFTWSKVKNVGTFGLNIGLLWIIESKWIGNVNNQSIYDIQTIPCDLVCVFC